MLGTKIYLIGGRIDVTGEGLDVISIWDTTQDASGSYDETSLKLPQPRYYHAAASYNGKLYVFGGIVKGSRSGSSIVYSDGKWTDLPQMPGLWAEITTGPLSVRKLS